MQWGLTSLRMKIWPVNGVWGGDLRHLHWSIVFIVGIKFKGNVGQEESHTFANL